MAEIRIPVEKLPPPDKNGDHAFQFRIISVDKNQWSAWSQLYIIKSIGQYRPLESDVTAIIAADEVTVTWDTPTIYNYSEDILIPDSGNIGTGSAGFVSSNGYASGKIIFATPPSRLLVAGDVFYITQTPWVQDIRFTVQSNSYTVIDGTPCFTVSVTADISHLPILEEHPDDVETLGFGWFEFATGLYLVNSATSASIAHNHSQNFKQHPTDIFVQWGSGSAMGNFEYHERSADDSTNILIPAGSASVRVVGTVALKDIPSQNTFEDDGDYQSRLDEYLGISGSVQGVYDLFKVFDTEVVSLT